MIYIYGRLFQSANRSPLVGANVVFTPRHIRGDGGQVFGNTVYGTLDDEGYLMPATESFRRLYFAEDIREIEIAPMDDTTIISVGIMHDTFTDVWRGEIAAKDGDRIDLATASPIMTEDDREDIGTFKELLELARGYSEDSADSANASEQSAKNSLASSKSSEESAAASLRYRTESMAARDASRTSARESADSAAASLTSAQGASSSATASRSSELAAGASAQRSLDSAGSSAGSATASASSAGDAAASAASAAVRARNSDSSATASSNFANASEGFKNEASASAVAAAAAAASSSGTKILVGTAVPTVAAPDGSFYFRQSATNSQRIINVYFRVSATWISTSFDSSSITASSETVIGGLRIANKAEAEAATNDLIAITPLKARQILQNASQLFTAGQFTGGASYKTVATEANFPLLFQKDGVGTSDTVTAPFDGICSLDFSAGISYTANPAAIDFYPRLAGVNGKRFSAIMPANSSVAFSRKFLVTSGTTIAVRIAAPAGIEFVAPRVDTTLLFTR